MIEYRLKKSFRIGNTARWALVWVSLLLPMTYLLSDEKATSIRAAAVGSAVPHSDKFLAPKPGGIGHKVSIGEGDHAFPLVVVRGTPYEMGWQLGQLTREQMHQFVPAAVAGISKQLEVSSELLREVWSRSAAYADDRVEQELAGLADGSGLPLSMLQAMHAVPLLMPYSCSSIAAWGNATEDGHLYQTRNLDWNLEVGAHEFPVIVVYIPNKGIPHVVPTFAGMIGAHTGMNARGIALSEMGDASGKEAPYQIHAPHFTVYFRTLLYDANSLSQAKDIFKEQPPTKRYHFVFGDGRTDKQAVKIRAHSPEPADRWLDIWTDNDPKDEFAPNILRCVVYNDEGRGAFPTLKKELGKLNGEKLVALANQIPIRGGNVENVVYDATALRMWVSYAKGKQEAYQREYAYIDLSKLDVDNDGQTDLRE
jgi:isopenicillin-N N-acyltransferase like protein